MYVQRLYAGLSIVNLGPCLWATQGPLCKIHLKLATNGVCILDLMCGFVCAGSTYPGQSGSAVQNPSSPNTNTASTASQSADTQS